MDILFRKAPLLVPALPVGLAILSALFIDRDFWFAVPLAMMLTIVVGVFSFLINRSGSWPLHALVGGVLGWVASVAVLMNLQI
jgi:hypothetical protein